MNLLITNTQEDQAYLVVRCLREAADRIVIAMHGDTRLQRWSGLAPWSRYVDKRYRAPEPSDDWWAGRIQRENTATEEAYVRQIEAICEREAITAIFPSFDTDIYVLSKNKDRLARQGVLVVGPDYDQLAVPMNKLRTLELARCVGFPCPLTFTPTDPKDLDDIVARVAPPWVVKPRFTAHGKETRIVTEPSELQDVFAAVSDRQAHPLVQEFIPGNARQNYYVVVDRNLNVVSMFCPRVIRTRQRGVIVGTSACISSSTGPFMEELHELIGRLGYWGCMTIQTKIDSRDGIPKLMEINPRVGDRLWYRTELGVNVPLIYLRLAQNKEPPRFNKFPDDVQILDPIDDLRNVGDRLIDAALGGFRRSLGIAEGTRSYREPEPLSRLLASIKESYFGGAEKALAPYVRHFFSDPLPSTLRNLKVLAGLARRRTHFSR